MLIKVFCVVSMLSKLPPAVCLRGGATGLLNKGGGSNRLPVEFPQVQTSLYNYSCAVGRGGGGGHHSQHIPTVHINELHCSIVVL